MKIIVDYNSLQKKGSFLVENAANLRTYLNQTTNQIERISGVWTGTTAREFQNNVKENHVSSLMKLQNILDSYGNYLINSSKAYQKLDEVFSSKKIK